MFQTNGRGRQGQGGSGGQGRGGCGDYRNSTIAKLSFDGKLKDGCLHKLTITECSHRATQFKKIHNALPVLCVDKGFKFVDDVICTNKELVKLDYLPTYPNTSLWSSIIYIQINTVELFVATDAQTGARPIIKVMAEKTRVFDSNMQKRLLSQYNSIRKSSHKNGQNTLPTRSH